MSKTRNRRQASDARPARRSLVDLSAAVSRAVDDALRPTSVNPVAALPDYPLSSGHAVAKRGRGKLVNPTATTDTIAGAQAAKADPVCESERMVSDSATEMMVKITKDYQGRVLDTIKASLNAALDQARDFAETGRANEQQSAPRAENPLLVALGDVTAACSAEALDLMQENFTIALDFARELAGVRTASEFVALSGTQARKSCELALRQADSLKSLARAVAEERDGGA